MVLPVPRKTLAQVALWTWRLGVVALLIWCGVLLRNIYRAQYTGPTYQEEQVAKNLAADLDAIRKALDSIERNTRPR